MIEDKKLIHDMLTLLGNIQAICFPLMWIEDNGMNQPYYDLIDSIKEQYVRILEKTIGYKND